MIADCCVDFFWLACTHGYCYVVVAVVVVAVGNAAVPTCSHYRCLPT